MTIHPAPTLSTERSANRSALDHVRVALFSRNARRWWAALLVVMTLYILSQALTPRPQGPSLSWDKANHVIAFAALAFAGLFSFRESARPVFWVSFLLLALGIAIEIVQIYVPGRSADVSDVFADAVGIALGLLLATLAARSLDRRRRSRLAGGLADSLS